MNEQETTPARTGIASPRPILTAERLREVLDYDPETGEFRWLPRPGVPTFNARLAGKVATGAVNEKGYVQIEIDGKRYRAHRLAHLWMTGEWPPASIDHMERNRADNRWSKLRPANRSQQAANQGLNTRNRSGVKGVFLDKERGLWRAIIEVNGREHYLGRYADFEKAVTARREAEVRIFGAFAYHARRAPEARAA
jgi:HNH endonuclease